MKILCHLLQTGSPAWRQVFWGCVTVVLVLSLIPATTELRGTGWDKSNHFIGFFTLALFGLQAYIRQPGRLMLGLLLFGGLIEVLQSFTPYRLAEWMDWFADGVGIVTGYGLHFLWQTMKASGGCAGKVKGER